MFESILDRPLLDGFAALGSSWGAFGELFPKRKGLVAVMLVTRRNGAGIAYAKSLAHEATQDRVAALDATLDDGRAVAQDPRPRGLDRALEENRTRGESRLAAFRPEGVEGA